MQAEPIHWSIAPCTAYGIDYEGQRLGIGLDPVFQAVPGAWNILVLSCSIIDDLLPWTNPPGEFPVSVVSMPSAVATALQRHSETGGRTLGDLAATMRPGQFLQAIEGMDDLIIVQLFGPAWWDLVRERAELLERMNRNVVRVDFRGRKVLH